MKLLQVLTVGVLVAAAANTASAQTTLRIAGSTAYRSAVTAAILNTLSAPVSVAYNASPSATALYGAGTQVFVGSDGTTVETDWTGSLAGVVDISVRNPLPFPNNTNTTSVFNPSASQYGTQLPGTLSAGQTDMTAPDVAMSDAFSTSIATIAATAPVTSAFGPGGAITNGTQLQTAINNAHLAAAGTSGAVKTPGTGHAKSALAVGIVPFEWLLDNFQSSTTKYTGTATFPNAAPFTDMTASLARNVIGGASSLSLFTGGTDAATKSTFVYLIGRNEDSATRIDSFAVAGAGLTPSVVQYLPAFTGSLKSDNAGNPTGAFGSSIASGSAPFPANTPLYTEPSINYNTAGHSGYIGGSDVIRALASFNGLTGIVPTGAPSQATGGKTYFVGYAGLADAANPSNAVNLFPLTYDGVAATPANVQTGAYTLWSLEHMYYLGAGVSGALANGSAAQTLANNIADAVFNTYACTDGSGLTAATINANNTASGTGPTDTVDGHSAAIQSLVATNGVFDGAGIYYDDGQALFGVTTDGGKNSLNY